MRKKGLVLVIAMLAIASMMAAMAYSSALVPNTTSSAVVNTNKALLSITENDNFKDFAKIGDDGKMYIDFTKAYGGGVLGGVSDSGFQPGSSYSFNDLIKITNNIDKDIKVGIRFDSSYAGDKTHFPKGLHTIQTSKTVTNGDSTYPKALIHVNSGVMEDSGNFQDVAQGAYVTLAPGETIGLSWNFAGVGALEAEKATTLQVLAKVDR